MERQIKKCSDTVKKEINVGTDVINDLVLYCHNQLDRLDVRIEQVIGKIKHTFFGKVLKFCATAISRNFTKF